MKQFVQQTLQGILDVEMRACCPTGRARPAKEGNCSRRHLHTRVGPVALRISHRCPEDFHASFTRYRAKETAILLALVRMYVRGLPSLATVQAIAETVCGHRLRPGATARAARLMQKEFSQWMRRQLQRDRVPCLTPALRRHVFHGEA